MDIKRSQRIQSLQVFRGVAALAVVMFHCMLSTQAFISEQHGKFITLLNMGYLGVDFFFVLSGFIIMHAHMNDVHEIRAMKVYIFKRLVRIYPTYLPIGIIMIVLYASLPSLSASGGRNFSLLSSIFLIPTSLPPALPVAWTLIHELMFYTVFLLFFVSLRWLTFGLMLWGILILIGLPYGVTGWLHYAFNPVNLEFILGVGAACLFNLKRALFDNYRTIIVIAGGIITTGSLILMIEFGGELALLRLVTAFGLVLIIIGVSLYEIAGILKWPTLSLLIGNASYSIYLIHNPLLSITPRLFGKLHFGWTFALILGILISLCAGIIYYFVVERSCQRFFKRYFLRLS